MSTKQFTELLPRLLAVVLSILNGFVQISQYLEHTLGYGWGYMAFVLLSAIAALWWPIARWADMVQPKDGSKGVSSAEAVKRTNVHFFLATVLWWAIDGYVYFHGGYTHLGQ